MTVSSYQVSWIRPSVDDGMERPSKIFSSAQTNLESTHSKFVTRTHLCESHNEVKILLFSIVYHVLLKDWNCALFQNGLAFFSLGLEAKRIFFTLEQNFIFSEATLDGGSSATVAVSRKVLPPDEIFRNFSKNFIWWEKGIFRPRLLTSLLNQT